MKDKDRGNGEGDCMERICMFDLGDIYKKPVTKRIRVAATVVRKIAARHTKLPAGKVKLSASVNDLLFSKGRMSIPHRIKVKITTDEKGAVVSLPEEKPRAAEKAEQKEARKPILEERKEPEKKPEEKQEKPKFEQKAVEAASTK